MRSVLPARIPPIALVRHLRLSRFKGFRDAELDFGETTVVVGTNAGGKSNLRDALRFLHGVGRGYTLAEIIGEKWVEGGVLQWRGIRGGAREITFDSAGHFAIEVGFGVRGPGGSLRAASYFIRVNAPTDTRQGPHVAEERLEIDGQPVFDSHPEKNPIRQDDPLRLRVRVRGRSRNIEYPNNQPALSQLEDAEESDVEEAIRDSRVIIRALQSMRFIDLDPEAMRRPSIPGQTILGDRGENLSSVLQAICTDTRRKDALVGWIKELTPLDVVDLDFPSDQSGKILVTLIEDGGRRTSAYSASDGTLRFLSTIAAFLGADLSHFFVFEELETGLHPTRLGLLVSLIEEQTGRGTCQVVLTTHSPQLLAFLSSHTIASAVLSYRVAGEVDQRLKRILDIPEAAEILKKQDLARLHASGWLEDAVSMAVRSEDLDGNAP